jgi:hypothetical protein
VITIDREVFSEDEELGISLENFAVVGDFDPETVAAALDGPAAERFMLVDEQGVVHTNTEAMDASGALPAASYVADAKVTPEGVLVYIDCQGAIEPAVGDAFKQVLVEVLDPVVDEARVALVRIIDDEAVVVPLN